MKKVSIQDLKANLSGAIAEAEAGGTLVITRHNEPVAQLSPAKPAHVRSPEGGVGRRLSPALRRATAGRYLEVLAEDRGGR
jgi:prevent-host-death family protein